jgi:hypothetical protein
LISRPKTAEQIMAKRSGEIPQQLSTEGPAPPPPVIRTATGSATGLGGSAPRGTAGKPTTGAAAVITTVTGDISLGSMIEHAMAQAIKDIQTESEAIQAETGSTDADKKARLDALNAPANVHARMQEARIKVKADWDVLYAEAQQP